MANSMNIDNNFRQVCVWPGTIVESNPEGIAEFESGMNEMFGIRVKFSECIYTYPDFGGDGNPVPDTGGRCDLFFFIHNEDISKFAIPRFNYGIRWIEDVYGNDQGYLYPERVKEYMRWGWSDHG